MNSKRQQALIEAAKSGDISSMRRLISSGADPFYFDKNGRNALDYTVEIDPIKAHALLIDLYQICTNPARQDILKYYLALTIKAGGRYKK